MAATWKARLGSIRAHLVVLVLSSVLGFAVLWVQGQYALNALEESAHQMGEGKDIVADILPPPLYLIESHLLAYQMLDAPVAQRSAIASQLNTLKQRYQERNALWFGHREHLDVSVALSLMGTQKQAADAYWDYVDREFVPAALEGRDADAKNAFASLNKLYQAHRTGVDATVKLAATWADARMEELHQTKQRTLLVLSLVASLCVAVALCLFVLVGRRIANMLGAEPAQLHREIVKLTPLEALASPGHGSVLHALRAAQERLQLQVAETERTNRELQATLHELNHMVGTDLLTGLWSRRRLEDALASEVERHQRYGQPLSLMFVDIDHFKAVNDQFGHPVGDQVLVALAAQIQLAQRAVDSIARWGGEEFVVVCPNTNLETATALAQRLRERIAKHEIPPVGRITLSVGVAEYQAPETWREWLQRADAALLAAKGQGRDRVWVAP
ncbi:MAG: hypothetical protein CFE39_03675 [Comamonadaceae bacterium PBBC2]|nr:MAG: hypothetical protein CFE39_03675 [Comamonadaceae bacterium PBBC2]